MIIRNSIRSTLRARGRTALFTALILLLTIFLTLGLGVWAYCTLTLSDMDRNYTSIALVEYMGTNYPEKDQGDEGARQSAQILDTEAISTIHGVDLWESTDQTLASMNGYARTGGYIPYEDYGILHISGLRPMYRAGTRWTDDASDLPRTCVLMNTATRDTTYYAEEMAPFYMPCYTKIDDVYYHYEREGDTFVLTPVPSEQLSSAYTVIEGEELSIKGRLPIEYSASEVINTICYYDPLKDLYGIPGQELYAYSASVVRVLQAKSCQEGILIWLEPGDFSFEPESGTSYLVHGTFIEAGTSYATFRLAEFPDRDETLPYLALSGDDDPALTQSIFTDYANFYKQSNNYIRIEASDDIASMECFHQNEIYLDQGRFPEALETGVCLIDGWTARQMDLSLGDTVDIHTMLSASDHRFHLTPEDTSKKLEVIGITNASDDYMGCLWVSGAEGGFKSPLFGYQLGRAVLDNNLGRKAADQIQAMVPAGVRVTLYDQGYSTAAQPIQAMASAALSVTSACALAVLVVLFLFASLFVGRQRETVQVLVSLGTPTGKIRLWLLSGAAVVAGTAALAGALSGDLLLENILRKALASMEQLYVVDQRYSEAAMGVVNAVEDTYTIPAWPAAAAGLSVFFSAVILCLIFLRQARRQSVPKKGHTHVRQPKGGTSTAGNGALRFALLSARRGGWRSYVVPAAAFILTLLLGLLASKAQSWGRQMDQLYLSSKISGEVTSTNGRQSTDLVVSARNARLLWESGRLSDISVSMDWNYWFTEDMPSFGIETSDSMNAWIASQPKIIALNDLCAAPAFYYNSLPDIQWLEGFDESFLQSDDYYSILDSMTFYANNSNASVGGKEWLTYPCLVNTSLLEEHNLTLGDTLEINVRIKDILGESKNIIVTVMAAGAYTGAESQKEIYVPLSFWCSPSWITSEKPPLADGERPVLQFSTKQEQDGFFYANTTFSTCRFTLNSARNLENFRDYLAVQGISQVGQLNSNRLTVMLRDESFVETVGGLNRYITFGRILLPALCLSVGFLGFIISWLMINGRKMEFAIMRGLGASMGRTFGSFFLEQAGLALTGCIPGGILLTVLQAGVTGWAAAAILGICYLTGSALAVLFVQRIKLISILSERE